MPGRVLDWEASKLGAAVAVVKDIFGRSATVDETLLTELGFEELQRRHETPTAYRVRCEDVADQRQSFDRRTDPV